MKITIDKIIRSNRKTIGLEISNSAKLIVRAPRSLTQDYIAKIIEGKSNWIEKTQRSIIERNRYFKPKEFKNGEKFLFLGELFELKIINNAEELLILNEKFLLSEKHQIKAKAIFIYWYKQQAKKIIGDRVKHYSNLFNLKFKSIKITYAKKRWGSHTGEGKLNFSYRLIMTPLEIIDYVVVHELTHTKFNNHSKDYWELVNSILPNYKSCEKWIKENGYKLRLE